MAGWETMLGDNKEVLKCVGQPEMAWMVCCMVLHGVSICFYAQHHLVLGTVILPQPCPVSTSGNYCCKHHTIGCAFNCDAGYDRWKQVRLCPETHLAQGHRKKLVCKSWRIAQVRPKVTDICKGACGMAWSSATSILFQWKATKQCFGSNGFHQRFAFGNSLKGPIWIWSPSGSKPS